MAGPTRTAHHPSGTGPQRPQRRQGAPRLLDTVRSPLFYLGVEPGLDGQAQASSEDGALSIQELLSDASLPLLLGWQSDGPAAAALSLLRRFLNGSESDLELALTNIVPSGLAGEGEGERPLLIFRGRLGAAEADAVRKLLLDERRAAPARGIQGHTIYALKGLSKAAPGALIEVAVLGQDLVVSNHGAAMESVLRAAVPAPGAAPEPKRTSTTTQVPLVVDPRFKRLRSNVELNPGGILLFVDGPRLSQRLIGGLEHGPVPMLRWSGLIRARAMLSALQSRDGSGGFVATVMVDLGAAPAIGDPPADGWLNALAPRTARDLASVLPGRGIGGVSMVFSSESLLDKDDVNPAGSLLRDMRNACADGCAQAGVDFEQHILRRLTGHGTLHVLSGIEGGLGHAWTFRARTPASARSLFRDLGVNAEEATAQEGSPWVQRIPATDTVPEMLRIRTRDNRALWIAVAKGEVVLAEDPACVAGLLELQATAERRSTARRKDSVLDALQLLGRTTRPEGGLLGAFDIDLMPGLERWVAEHHGDEGMQALQGSVLPLRWIGFLDRTDGLLRVQVLGRR